MGVPRSRSDRGHPPEDGWRLLILDGGGAGFQRLQVVAVGGELLLVLPVQLEVGGGDEAVPELIGREGLLFVDAANEPILRVDLRPELLGQRLVVVQRRRRGFNRV